jgi:hypothetical protein
MFIEIKILLIKSAILEGSNRLEMRIKQERDIGTKRIWYFDMSEVQELIEDHR